MRKLAGIAIRKLVGILFYLLAIAFFTDVILGVYVVGFRAWQLPVFGLGVLTLAIGSTLLRRPTTGTEADRGRSAKPTDLESARAEVAAKLPAKYDALSLSFYGSAATAFGDMIVIGDDHGARLCVYSGDGHIRSINEDELQPSRFVNSSIDQLSRFLAEYERVVSDGPKASSDEERIGCIQDLRARLQSIDPAAFAKPENWWPAVLEHLDEGRSKHR